MYDPTNKETRYVIHKENTKRAATRCDDSGALRILAMYIGEHSPRLPFDKTIKDDVELQRSVEFWNRHALIMGTFHINDYDIIYTGEQPNEEEIRAQEVCIAE